MGLSVLQYHTCLANVQFLSESKVVMVFTFYLRMLREKITYLLISSVVERIRNLNILLINNYPAKSRGISPDT